MSREIFISYSSLNYPEAQRLGKELDLIGLSYWLAPNQLIYGPEYSGQITEAIRNAEILIVLISKESLQSHQVFNEIALATEFKKEIIAYRLDDAPLTDKFKYYLVGRHWVDAQTDRMVAITKLVHLIHDLRNNRSEKPKSPEVLEMQRHNTEMIFLFARAGIAMVTLIVWLIAVFLLHGSAFGSISYTIGIVVATAVEVVALIVILGPIFGGPVKMIKTAVKEIIKAFKGT